MSSDVASGREIRLAFRYLDAKLEVIRAGFCSEITSEPSHISRLTETAFLREAAWVVLSSGMREAVVRRKFDAISDAFYGWRSAALIQARAQECESLAAVHFAHSAKLHAITTIAARVANRGFAQFKAELQDDPIESLSKLPFMGPATTRHLAKNIGYDVVKPDRHLIRIAEAAQFESVDSLCRAISSLVGDRVSAIDSVLWRYATLRSDYVNDFRES